MFIELRIKQQNESFHWAAVFLQPRQSCNFSAAAPVFSLFLCCRTLGSVWLRRNRRVGSLEGCLSSIPHRRGLRLSPSARTAARSWTTGWTLSTSTSSIRVSAFQEKTYLEAGAKVERGQSGKWTADSPSVRVSLTKPGQWLHCCNQLMKIEVVSPRKPSLFLTKQADCVYNDLSE